MRIAARPERCQTNAKLPRTSTKLVIAMPRPGNMIPIRTALPAALFLLAIEMPFPAAAQTDAASWQKETQFAGLDQNGLSPAQKSTLLNVLRTGSCNCGCTMKVAECRVKDPRCGRSRGLSATVVRELREGKSADAILADLAKRMNEAPPLLEEPVPIPINGAPVKGAANAKITLVEFSDFQ